jgi:hypothetical protein
MALLNSIPESAAPDNFTEKVMNAVYKIKYENSQMTDSFKENYRQAMRRLGISMVLTSVVMVISLTSPVLNIVELEGRAASRIESIKGKTESIVNSVGEVNYRIKNFYRDFNNTFGKFRED